MKKQPLISAVLVASTATLILAGATTLFANGGLFFAPAGQGPVDLVYFGRVKDAQTGRTIRIEPHIDIVDPYTGLYFPFGGDMPGHFRSPDIGAAIKEITDTPIDTKRFQIMVSAKGYKDAEVTVIPRRSKGAIELNVKLEPEPDDPTANTAAAAASNGDSSQSGTADTVPVTDSSKPTFFLLAACFGLAAISAVARTVGRPASTER
jgi:hypothetical protein